MLPVRMMHDAKELRHWVGRAFRAVAKLPEKKAKAARKAGKTAKATPTRKAPRAKRS